MPIGSTREAYWVAYDRMAYSFWRRVPPWWLSLILGAVWAAQAVVTPSRLAPRLLYVVLAIGFTMAAVVDLRRLRSRS